MENKASNPGYGSGSEGIRFGVLRKYCSRTDRLSICMLETLQYENYISIREVPEDYDKLYLHGFGIIESEFRDEDGVRVPETCLEILLDTEPRQFDEGKA